MSKRKLEDEEESKMVQAVKKHKAEHSINRNSLMRLALVCSKKQASPLLKVFLFGEGTDWLQWRTVCKDWAISRSLIASRILWIEAAKALKWEIDYFYSWYTKCPCSEYGYLDVYHPRDPFEYVRLKPPCRAVVSMLRLMGGCFSRNPIDRKECWRFIQCQLDRKKIL